MSFKNKRGFTSKPQKDDKDVRRSLTTPAEDSSLIEILDRILDNGIVLDPSSRMRVSGLALEDAKEHVVIDWRKTF